MPKRSLALAVPSQAAIYLIVKVWLIIALTYLSGPMITA